MTSLFSDIFPHGRADLFQLKENIRAYKNNATSDHNRITHNFNEFLCEYSNHFSSVDELEENDLEYDMYHRELQLSARGHLISYCLLLEGLLRHTWKEMKLGNPKGFFMKEATSALRSQNSLSEKAVSLIDLAWDVRNVIVHQNGNLGELQHEGKNKDIARTATNQTIGLSLKEKIVPSRRGRTEFIILIDASFISNLVEATEQELIDLHEKTGITYTDWFW
ncbi:MAG: hypothetical protein OIF57_17705 [Marinobacterium sp.]|nr:hypothetical protein [Marinobacterium sp.]